jgi:hypothetical protein
MKMSDMKKPDVEQVAWVFEKIIQNTKDCAGTFRYLIYDLMGFSEQDYEKLYRAGGLAINNAMTNYWDGEGGRNDSRNLP